MAIGFLTTGTSAQVFVLLLGGLVLGVWGLLDDWVTVRPPVKLLVEASAVALWFSDVRAGLFGNEVLDLALTVLWVVAVTNALNLLDNMDGLTAGVSTWPPSLSSRSRRRGATTWWRRSRWRSLGRAWDSCSTTFRRRRSSWGTRAR